MKPPFAFFTPLIESESQRGLKRVREQLKFDGADTGPAPSLRTLVSVPFPPPLGAQSGLPPSSWSRLAALGYSGELRDSMWTRAPGTRPKPASECSCTHTPPYPEKNGKKISLNSCFAKYSNPSVSQARQRLPLLRPEDLTRMKVPACAALFK